jgi:hypothetical protein
MCAGAGVSRQAVLSEDPSLLAGTFSSGAGEKFYNGVLWYFSESTTSQVCAGPPQLNIPLKSGSTLYVASSAPCTILLYLEEAPA